MTAPDPTAQNAGVSAPGTSASAPDHTAALHTPLAGGNRRVIADEDRPFGPPTDRQVPRLRQRLQGNPGLLGSTHVNAMINDSECDGRS
jgi:hypothetical protein